jgi:hypothetical protein
MSFNISFTEEQSWYEENYEVENANEIKTEDLEECEYKNMRSTFDLFEKLKIENDKLKTENEELKEQNKECLNLTDWKDEWMEENLDINDVGNASVKISNYQDSMEEDMVEYFNENKDDMMEDLKNEWLKVFMEDSICEDDFVENCDDVGVLYDNIKEYFIHSLDVDEDDISNWENDVDSDGESDEED